MGSRETLEKQCSVAIVGGGIGGLTLAIGLLRRNVKVQIYEAAASFEEMGLGLSIGPAAHRTMPLIDPFIREAYDKLVTTHADSPGYEHLRQTWFEIIWATGDKSGDTLLDLKAPPSGQTTVRRADFQDALVDLVPPEIRHFGKRLESLSEDTDAVTMNFKDGTLATADIVIGCDGIKSKVKEYIIPNEYKRAQPQYSGMYGYRTVLDMDTMIEAVGDRRARVSSMYLGKGMYGISYPIMRAKKVNVGLYKLSDEWSHESWVRPTPRAEMIKDFEHAGQHIHALMKVSHRISLPFLFVLKSSPISRTIEDTYPHSEDARFLPMGHLRAPLHIHLPPFPRCHPRRRRPRLNPAPRCRRRPSHRGCPRPYRTAR